MFTKRSIGRGARMAWGPGLLLVLVLSFLLSGCVPPSQSSYQAYEDPRELIGEGGVNPTAKYSSLKLGVIYSKNARNAFSHLSQIRQQYAMWGMNSYDPEVLERNIKAVLAHRFGEAVEIASMDEAMGKSVDVVMVLDMKVTIGQVSGSETSILINGIFMDLETNVIEKVTAQASKPLPWPAYPQYDFVAPEAARQFGIAFDSAKPLLEKLAALERGPALPPVTASAPAGPAPSVNYAKRAALVIGNGAYGTGRLRNPVNDARDMSRRLKEAGFDVILVKNGDLRMMEAGVDRLWSTLRKGGVGVFYYAGHAMQVQGRNYLIPIGASIRTESDIRYEAVDVGRILGRMEDAGNGLNIVVLDACRNNPFARSFRSADRGLAIMDAPSGSLIAYSTSPGAIAEDGPGRNGTYTKHLLRHLLTPGLTIEDVLKRVRIDVSSETNGRQIPWESSSLTGYFYFGKPE